MTRVLTAPSLHPPLYMSPHLSSLGNGMTSIALWAPYLSTMVSREQTHTDKLYVVCLVRGVR